MQQTNVRQCGYSITSAASASSLSGTVSPSAFDDQLKFCRRLHGEIGSLLALEDAVDISCRQAKLFGKIRPIRDQAA
jgi:hypothetical protein